MIMGKSNYYDKMEWQDSIKVIITQKFKFCSKCDFKRMTSYDPILSDRNTTDYFLYLGQIMKKLVSHVNK